MPTTGQSKCRGESLLIAGLALQRRPKNVMSTPRGEVLIGQHPDMFAGGQRARHLDRRLVAGANQLAHRGGADALDFPRDDPGCLGMR